MIVFHGHCRQREAETANLREVFAHRPQAAFSCPERFSRMKTETSTQTAAPEIERGAAPDFYIRFLEKLLQDIEDLAEIPSRIGRARPDYEATMNKRAAVINFLRESGTAPVDLEMLFMDIAPEDHRNFDFVLLVLQCLRDFAIAEEAQRRGQ